MGTAVSKGTPSSIIVIALQYVISISATRLRIIGALLPLFVGFLKRLHATIVNAVREERMAAELDTLDETRED